MHTTELYFESHITIEPVFENKLEKLKRVVAEYGFRVADLLMRKRLKDDPERSKFDTFCTSRDLFYVDIERRTKECVEALKASGYQVWRFKIENTLLDVKLKEQE